MEVSFNDLKKLDVICVTDGKNLGKVCDVIFLWKENSIKGFTLTGGKGFRFTKQEVFVPVANVIKIGEDVMLIKSDEKKKPDDCPPHGKHKKGSDCNPCPPCPPCPPFNSRRDFDEYE
ncbi:MAG: PRC-barrel domain-containing protein [Candidatus Coproplasma sp.]